MWYQKWSGRQVENDQPSVSLRSRLLDRVRTEDEDVSYFVHFPQDSAASVSEAMTIELAIERRFGSPG